ncbi:MAG: hypothetical protein K6G85_02990 [Eubacterium sp.]|nr:hypothetical protein [Eubacterium sp.]
MRKEIRFLATFLTMAVLATSIGTQTVSAKTVKNYFVTKDLTYGKNSKNQWYLKYQHKDSYSKNGKWLGYEYKNYDENGKKTFSGKYQIKLDKKGRNKSSVSYYNGKLEKLEKVSYKGKTQTIKIYDGKKKLTGKEVIKESKRKSKAIIYNAKGKKTGTRNMTFDKKGNVKKIVTKNNGKLSSYSKFSKNKDIAKYYHENGKLNSVSITLRKKGKNVKTEYNNYDENGKLINSELTTYKNGKELKTVRKDYANGKAETTEETTYSYKKGFTIETSLDYTYYGVDSEGNKPVYKTVEKYKVDKAGNRILSWKKTYSDDRIIDEYSYKYKKYTKGAAKGCVKEEIQSCNGKAQEKIVYTIKVIKVEE